MSHRRAAPRHRLLGVKETTDPRAPRSGAFARSCSGPNACTLGLVSRSLLSGGQGPASALLLVPFRKRHPFEEWIPLSLQTLDAVPGAAGVPRLLRWRVTHTDPGHAAFLPLASPCVKVSAFIDGTNRL